MNHLSIPWPPWGASLLAALSVAMSGCGTSTTDGPAVNGRRVQNTTVVARGSVPFQLSALEALQLRGDRRAAADTTHATPLAVRVVVHEGSGDVTLTTRR